MSATAYLKTSQWQEMWAYSIFTPNTERANAARNMIFYGMSRTGRKGMFNAKRPLRTRDRTCGLTANKGPNRLASRAIKRSIPGSDAPYTCRRRRVRDALRALVFNQARAAQDHSSGDPR